MRLRLAALVVGALMSLGGCGDDDGPGAPDAGFQPWTLEDVNPPDGFMFRSPEFEVPAGQEIQDCYFIAVPDVNGDGTPVHIDRIQTAINPGSHHMNVFRVKTIVALDGAPGDVVHDGECFKSANWADWPLVANSQNSDPTDPYTDWRLPDDVALYFTPGEKLMLQVHYVNAATQDTPFLGKFGVNFYEDKDDPAPMELGTLFATQQSIRICRSNPEVSFSGTCSFPAGTSVTITAANGHFHSRGEQFRMWAWDGVSTSEPTAPPFYRSDTWADPPMERDLTVVVPDGGGIWWTCDFQWAEPIAPATCEQLDAIDLMRNPGATPDCCYTFGPKVESNEHCNAFIYFYPKVDRTDIFCN